MPNMYARVHVGAYNVLVLVNFQTSQTGDVHAEETRSDESGRGQHSNLRKVQKQAGRGLQQWRHLCVSEAPSITHLTK